MTVHRSHLPLPFLFLFLIVLTMNGCFGPKKISSPIDNIRCTVTFKNIADEDVQDRIEASIRSVALSGDVEKGGTATSPHYRFSVRSLDVLDQLHPQIIFKDPNVKSTKLQQVFNDTNPTFSIDYGMIGIAASIEVAVTFHITPGARLYYISEGNDEQDITSLVDSSGTVRLETKIAKGQEHIYARTVSDKVERYIKINIYSQDVEDISREDYPN